MRWAIVFYNVATARTECLVYATKAEAIYALDSKQWFTAYECILIPVVN
jgi:hypothetical protein